MGHLRLRERDDRNHRLSSEEDYLVSLDSDHVGTLRRPLNGLVSGAFEADDILVKLAILSSLFIKLVDNHILAS